MVIVGTRLSDHVTLIPDDVLARAPLARWQHA